MQIAFSVTPADPCKQEKRYENDRVNADILLRSHRKRYRFQWLPCKRGLRFSFPNFSNTHSGAIGESSRENLLMKSRNQNIFGKFTLNRNLQTIHFKMMYNMSILRHRVSNERWGAPWTTFLSYPVSVYFTQTDFPEYSQYQMPDNQTVSHSQSFFDQKKWFKFFSFGSI